MRRGKVGAGLDRLQVKDGDWCCVIHTARKVLRSGAKDILIIGGSGV